MRYSRKVEYEGNENTTRWRKLRGIKEKRKRRHILEKIKQMRRRRKNAR
jgi:hypothetical protein